MEVRDMIAKLMLEKGITYAELEKRTGIPRSTLNRYVNGVTKNLTIDNLELIAKGLNVKPVSFFVAGQVIEPEEGHDYIDPAAAIAREATGTVPEEPVEDLNQKRAEFLLESLERLAKLYNTGVLTAEEFALAKKKLLEV